MQPAACVRESVKLLIKREGSFIEGSGRKPFSVVCDDLHAARVDISATHRQKIHALYVYWVEGVLVGMW